MVVTLPAGRQLRRRKLNFEDNQGKGDGKENYDRISLSFFLNHEERGEVGRETERQTDSNTHDTGSIWLDTIDREQGRIHGYQSLTKG